MKNNKNKKYKIIIEFDNNYNKQDVEDKMSDVEQLFMCRNPLDEPHIYVEETPFDKDAIMD